ncbi:hypothetical protein EJ08DRAFT_205823 [Tothia fuscella]|uniref:Uncharacterized protein n=1 Tax=Tothia fuscella TaxID=1048955 RepID=A0A9P4NTK2_9PEZI|nr:hypothetical protein EJ08DRAFT_205823 [Tothia fuscella]
MDTSTNSKSLCFMEAFEAKERQEISHEEYLDHLLTHCNGIRHEYDKWPYDLDGLDEADPFGLSIRVWTAGLKEGIIKDTSAMKGILMAYHNGKDATVTTDLAQLEQQQATYLCESLAVASSLDNRPVVFKFCMDKGFCYRGPFLMHTDRLQEAGNTTPKEISEILDASQFRKSFPRF